MINTFYKPATHAPIFIRFLFCLLLIISTPSVGAAQSLDSTTLTNAITKCWRTFSHQYANIYALEEEEIKQYSKQRVCLSKDSISLFTGISTAPTFSFRKVHAEDYTKNNYDCTKRMLSIMVDSLVEVTVNSYSQNNKDNTKHKLTNIMTYDGQCLYIMADGVIFKMLDADSKVQPRTSN
jgi:hypothetical protein